MSLAGLVDRYGRAIVLAVALLAGAGLIAGRGSAQQHLSAPRVSARRHHRPQRDAACARHDAVGHAPARTGRDGSAGHPPRPLDDVPRCDRDLGAVRAVHRHGRRAAAGAGQDRRCPAVASRGHRSDRRTPDARGVPDVHPQPDRPVVCRRSLRLRVLRDAAAPRPRCRRGAG